jgi:hypothetical protein
VHPHRLFHADAGPVLVQIIPPERPADLQSDDLAVRGPEKYDALRAASVLGRELGQESAYLEINAAKVGASLGDHAGAGHHYECAARVILKDPQVKFEGATSPWQAQANFLREAESHFKLAGLTDREEKGRYDRLLLHRDHEEKFWPRRCSRSNVAFAA